MIYLDTHVVIWLNIGLGAKLPDAARGRIEQDDVRISPVVTLELEYLFELGRVAGPAHTVVDRMASMIGLQVCREPFAEVVRSSIGQSWTRDPFDRIIVGHAALRRRPLVTKDRLIRAHYPQAVWSGSP